jgi:hypothetical protein
MKWKTKNTTSSEHFKNTIELVEPGKRAVMYLCVRGIEPGKRAVMYLCVRGIEFSSFYDFYCIFEMFRRCGIFGFSFHLSPNTQIHDRSLSWLDTPNTQIHDRSLSWLDTPNTQIHDRSLSWLGIDTSIKSGGVKLVSWVQTSPSSEMMRSCKCLLHVSKIPSILVLPKNILKDKIRRFFNM